MYNSFWYECKVLHISTESGPLVKPDCSLFLCHSLQSEQWYTLIKNAWFLWYNSALSTISTGAVSILHHISSKMPQCKLYVAHFLLYFFTIIDKSVALQKKNFTVWLRLRYMCTVNYVNCWIISRPLYIISTYKAPPTTRYVDALLYVYVCVQKIS